MIHFRNGDKYQGDVRNDAMHGQGEYLYASGIRYKGGFRQDKDNGGEASGIGIVVFLDESVLDGFFAKDCPLHGTLTAGGLRYAVKYDGVTEIAEVRAGGCRAPSMVEALPHTIPNRPSCKAIQFLFYL